MRREAVEVTDDLGIYWCLTCAVVWADSEGPPICRHMVIDGQPPKRMEPLPPWHPFHPQYREPSFA